MKRKSKKPAEKALPLSVKVFRKINSNLCMYDKKFSGAVDDNSTRIINYYVRYPYLESENNIKFNPLFEDIAANFYDHIRNDLAKKASADIKNLPYCAVLNWEAKEENGVLHLTIFSYSGPAAKRRMKKAYELYYSLSHDLIMKKTAKKSKKCILIRKKRKNY